MSVIDDIKAAAMAGEAQRAAKKAAENAAEAAENAARAARAVARIPENDAWVRDRFPNIVRELTAQGTRTWSTEDEGYAQALTRAGLDVKCGSYDVSRADDMYPDTRWYWTVSW